MSRWSCHFSIPTAALFLNGETRAHAVANGSADGSERLYPIIISKYQPGFTFKGVTGPFGDDFDRAACGIAAI